MNTTSVYYKDSGRTLHHIKADTNNVQEARDAVLDMLEVSKQAFLHPVLALANNGEHE